MTTVSQLIEELRKHPPDAKVYVEFWIWNEIIVKSYEERAEDAVILCAKEDCNSCASGVNTG